MTGFGRAGLPPHRAIQRGPRVSRALLQSLSQTMRSRGRLVGDGPAEASTSTTVERQPFIWDCNGYYRALGLPTDATRVEVASAYIECDGYRDPYLTQAARTLIDKPDRRRYDALSLGTFLADDPNLHDSIVARGEVQEWAESSSCAWSVYLTDNIDESEIERIHPSWWGVIAVCLSALGVKDTFAIGLNMEGGVATIGWRDVIFIPLRLAHHCDRDYASEIAKFYLENLGGSTRPRDGFIS